MTVNVAEGRSLSSKQIVASSLGCYSTDEILGWAVPEGHELVEWERHLLTKEERREMDLKWHEDVYTIRTGALADIGLYMEAGA